MHADHDMIYLEPFKGHKEIREYFDKVVSIVPSDLKFTVEDITDGDPQKVGVKWCALVQFFGSLHCVGLIKLACCTGLIDLVHSTDWSLSDY
jgi:hypothetical protein